MTEKYKGSCRVVLLAENDLEMRLVLSKALQKEGCSVIECKDGIDLYTRLSPLLKGDYDMEYDLIITDIRMPVITGMEIIEDLSDIKNSPPVIIITSSGDIFTRERAQRLGASALDKQLNVEHLTKVVRDTILASRSSNGARYRPAIN
jgi:CheY-like chemotaxis protein